VFAAVAQTGDRPRLMAQVASGQVIACAWSADGRTVLTGGREGKARLWDAASGEELQSYQGEAGITHMAFSTDHRNVLTVSSIDEKTTVQLWDEASGKELGRITPAGGLIYGIDSADGSTIATANWVDSDGQGNKLPTGAAKIQLWNMLTGKELRHFEQALGTEPFGAISPDGRRVLIGGQDGATMLWDVDSGKELARLYGFMDGSWAVVDSEGRFDTD
jgi:WD40 repeat protein